MFDPSLLYDVYAPAPVVVQTSCSTPTSPPESERSSLSSSSSSSHSSSLGVFNPKKRKEREEAKNAHYAKNNVLDLCNANDANDAKNAHYASSSLPHIANCFLQTDRGLLAPTAPTPPGPRLVPSPTPSSPPDGQRFSLPPLVSSLMVQEIGADLNRDAADHSEPDVATGAAPLAPLATSQFEQEIAAALARPPASSVLVSDETYDGTSSAQQQPLVGGFGLMQTEVNQYGSLKSYYQSKAGNGASSSFRRDLRPDTAHVDPPPVGQTEKASEC